MKKRTFGTYSLAIGAFAMVMTGCGGKKDESTEAPASTAAPAAGKMVDAATAGEVTGTVKLDGAAPKMRNINMAAEPNCAKAHSGPVTSEEVVTGDGGALANVVVYVKSGLDGYSFPAPIHARKVRTAGLPVSSSRRRRHGRAEHRHRQRGHDHPQHSPHPKGQPGMERVPAARSCSHREVIPSRRNRHPCKVQHPPVDEGLHGRVCRIPISR